MGKFRQSLIRFMAGRRGQDEFCVALFGAGLFFWLLAILLSRTLATNDHDL